MKALTFLCVVGLLALLPVLMSSSAPPAPPMPFSITLSGFFTSLTSSAGGEFGLPGGWTSTGAINDSGTYHNSWTPSGNPDPGAPSSAAHVTTVLTSSQGTITFRSDCVTTAIGTFRALDGPSRIIDATGIYAGMKAHGDTHAEGDLATFPVVPATGYWNGVVTP